MLNFYYILPLTLIEGITLKYATIHFGNDGVVDIEYNVTPGTKAYEEAIWFDNLTYTW